MCQKYVLKTGNMMPPGFVAAAGTISPAFYTQEEGIEMELGKISRSCCVTSPPADE
jgi:hypothetical protein